MMVYVDNTVRSYQITYPTLEVNGIDMNPDTPLVDDIQVIVTSTYNNRVENCYVNFTAQLFTNIGNTNLYMTGLYNEK
jgi:hypothetical protein